MDSPSALSIVRDSLKSYRCEADEWRPDHDVTMKCHEIEDFLRAGIVIFDSLVEMDEKYRERVLSGKISHDPRTDKALMGAFAMWLRPCVNIKRALAAFENRFGTVEHAEEFRSRCREAEGMLVKDGEFFSGDALTELRDEAIDAHRRGETLDAGAC